MSKSNANLSAQIGQTTVNHQSSSATQAAASSAARQSAGQSVLNQLLEQQTWAAAVSPQAKSAAGSESIRGLNTASAAQLDLSIGSNRVAQSQSSTKASDGLSTANENAAGLLPVMVDGKLMVPFSDGLQTNYFYVETDDTLPAAGAADKTAAKVSSAADFETEKTVAAAGAVKQTAAAKTDAVATQGKVQTASAAQTAAEKTVKATETASATVKKETAAATVQPVKTTDTAATAAKAAQTAAAKTTVVKTSTVAASKAAAVAEKTVEKVTEKAAVTAKTETAVPQAGAAPTAAASSTSAAATKAATTAAYKVYTSKQYGSYVKVTDFGADPTGKKDSYAAIQKALAAANKEKAMLYMEGTFYTSKQITIDSSLANVKGIFGAGMDKTVIRFDKKQVGVFNPNSNDDDIREYAGILVDGQNGKKIAALSVEYTGGDFYRKGLSYFGKVTGILVNDADNTLIDSVEVSGVNRAGVFFTSTAALSKEAGQSSTYKQRVADGKIDETYAKLPLGENNKVINSNLHDNRVAGLMVAYQENFTASGNTLSYNGHKADGGTGYGAAVMAGSYNYGITFTKNTTDHNYRKGLDVHDGTDIVITDNTLNGDRLYGIAVYNRMFSMDNVVISGNVITQDKNNRLAKDDDLGTQYQLYSAIQLQTNTQFRDLHSAATGYFEISNNTIKNLTLYGNNIQQYGIEFRNHETKMNYTANITGNNISGESTKYLIAVINDTQNQITGKSGLGSGTINISDNTADIGTISKGAVPVYVEEKNVNGVAQRGEVIIDSNDITVRNRSDGYAEFSFMMGNAAKYSVTNNRLDLGGKLENPIVEVRDLGRKAGDVEISVAKNTITTDIKGKLYSSWVSTTEVETYAEANTHNGETLDTVNKTGHKVSLSDVLSSVSQSISAINHTAYDVKHTLKIEDNTVNTGIL